MQRSPLEYIVLAELSSIIIPNLLVQGNNLQYYYFKNASGIGLNLREFFEVIYFMRCMGKQL